MKGRIRRVGTEEDGVALGLAILVVVVVGVIGAGLLVFARNDLAAVIQSNQGQRAFYAAEAGVQSAKLELLTDALPSSYDVDYEVDDKVDYEGSELYGSAACNVLEESRDSEYSEGSGGVTKPFAGGEFTTKIRWLASGCGAPPIGGAGSEYFRVISTGTFGEATRRIEAVYATSDVGAPLANYAAGDVTISQSATVSGGSVFSGGDVELENSDSLHEKDEVYGDWATGAEVDGVSEVSRPVEEAGIGAVGEISGDRERVEDRDFDGASSPSFAASPTAGALTFPFDPDYWASASALDFLKTEATAQGNYLTSGSGFSWPEESSDETVVYLDLTGDSGRLEWDSGVCEEVSECRGTLVVEGGSFELLAGSAFGGAVVAAGGEEPDSLSVNIAEGALLEGFANSSGTLDISGEVSAAGAGESRIRPGFYGVERWSWRELYE